MAEVVTEESIWRALDTRLLSSPRTPPVQNCPAFWGLSLQSIEEAYLDMTKHQLPESKKSDSTIRATCLQILPSSWTTVYIHFHPFYKYCITNFPRLITEVLGKGCTACCE
ncbi:hypothetical protein J6590_065454 [Homalodisca vitripennis]|nr:hypothetical protein J6590_065454 [Homalodisca vitripennis]